MPKVAKSVIEWMMPAEDEEVPAYMIGGCKKIEYLWMLQMARIIYMFLSCGRLLSQ